MKAWLNQFKISDSLDDKDVRMQMPKQAKTDNLRQFRDSLRSLDRRLKSDQPTPPVPDGLHHSVMQAVRAVSKESERRFAVRNLRWLPATATALLVVTGGLWILNRPEPSPQPLAAAAALEQGQQLTQQAPVAVLAPLSKEMENLSRDFRSAVEMLIASVP